MRRGVDFRATMRGGRKSASRSVLVHMRYGSDETGPLVGFAVSKAVGSAVVRNRVRRRLRHLMRGRVADLPAGSSVVVRALPASATASYVALASDLDAALGRLAEPGRVQ